MKITIAQGLLCVLVGASAAAATTMQSTTPRYNNVNDENLNLKQSSFRSSPLSQREIFLNSSFLSNIYKPRNKVLRNLVTILISPRRSRKLELTMDSIRSSVKNNPSSYFKDNTKFKKNININRHRNVTLHKKIAVRNKNVFGRIANATRPNVKHKSTTSKPTKVIITKSSKHSHKKILNTTTATNLSLKTKPLNLTKDIIRLQNTHFKNYTKFRIKPSNKQVNDIHPEIITYSPSGVSSLSSSQQIYPQIYTYSPETSISSALSANTEESSGHPTKLANSKTPISQVIFQSQPIDNTGTKDALANDCPSFSITSNIFQPQRQGCSDLDVVINSHLNQNVITEAVPQIEPLASDIQETAADESIPDDAGSPALDSSASQAAAPAAPAASPSGGSQGGGLPQLPQLPHLGLPDLKGLFDLLGVLWRIISSIFGFLSNPYLYLVPAGISFGLGFLKILAAFKLFILIPALLLFGYVNRDKPPEVAYYKHVHKPVHHYDGWFWNHNSKTWKNIVEYVNVDHSKTVDKS